MTPEELEHRAILLARAALEGRLVETVRAAGRQRLELFAPARSTSSPERRSPVSSAPDSEPLTVPTTTLQKKGSQP